MVWETPKTDWYGSYNSTTDTYEGDYFNASDYNRIKNNIQYLYELASELYYPSFTIDDMGDDKDYSSFFYADELNTIINNLNTINNNSVNVTGYSISATYRANSSLPSHIIWNRIESLSLKMYELMSNQYKGRRMFKWNFGIKEGF